ncbi:single-stranded-DNA-specific exonuclease RecJ [Panacibacter ginsenosidivorans]|uniref:Single-stranded-DNA-specific exonuclease RecJ n=1 Tax=Panacibacter ginsenosidivorans TaxID=1813871 RepID=A0A5B8V9S7_9BACT|nr:single-stranded-DNA-specific exonuclease RecJ [Panacibacter ginsenosidivorans]QEC67611.1 single-stranded-DNA-specific exonuclease RecJ [Panacibacter ginsenosidivorans]
MQKRWNIKKENEQDSATLSKALKIHPALCKILVQRGFNTFDKAKSFFRPQLSDLHAPWLMKDMRLAVQRIEGAINNKENILVFGDYDVDGTTAVACMYRFLKNQYSNVEFYIPHRYREGYGVSKAGIDFAKENNFTLIISLDCGIKSVDLITYAKTLGIDFIVCDHHLPDIEVPPAVAILNPKQKDCNYPYKELCGCGVGFKLIQALCETWQLPDTYFLEFLDLVATAIAADIVPVTGENRVLAFYGLKKVNENPCTGIKALLKLAAQEKEVHITNLVFIVAPRINAAGRMDDAKKAVQLFIENDFDKALEYAEMLHNDNTDRREADSNITEEALAIIQNDVSLINRKTTVVYRDHWHKGVVGIVASRLIESYYRPTIVLTKSGDIVAGSARSVPGFNLYEAIHACRQSLLGYGGHFAAAGMTLLEENVKAFADKFEEVVHNTITEESLIPEIVIDAAINFRDITQTFYSIILQMEPFGPGNMRPVFITRNAGETGFSKVVKEKHVRFVARQDGITLTGIGFNLAEKFHLLQKDKPFDIVYTLDMNEWNGQQSLQLRVIDFNIPQV